MYAIRSYYVRNFGLDQADWWISLGAPSSAVAIFEPVVMTNDAEALRLLRVPIRFSSSQWLRLPPSLRT